LRLSHAPVALASLSSLATRKGGLYR
jgi:hypothetical protein